ncbi:MAG: chorismate synthase [Rectinemataceae bacterium]|jgi:chorismate synthase
MNSFGRLFRVELFGESHGPAVGAIVDGCPAGLALSLGDLEPDLARRRSGAAGSTERHEADSPEILSGVYQGRTTGSPICIVMRNADTRSQDYEDFRRVPRPGHADFTSRYKYGGFSDPRGSGHFSGRITAGLVAAGAVAKLVLRNYVARDYAARNGIARDGSAVTVVAFETRVLEAGGRRVSDAAEVEAASDEAKAAGDSIGGLVEIRVNGLPPGLGEPFFDAAESLIAHALFAVPAVRGVEFGDGFAAARMRGTEHNDPFVDRSGRTAKNGAGGINGGITNGNELVVRVAVKPASTVSAPQRTLDFESGEETVLAPGGRHDACIALRAAVVLEAACAIALADLLLASRSTAARTVEVS